MIINFPFRNKSVAITNEGDASDENKQFYDAINLFKTQRKNVSIEDGKELVLDFLLKQSLVDLDEVVSFKNEVDSKKLNIGIAWSGNFYGTKHQVRVRRQEAAGGYAGGQGQGRG